MKNHPNRTTIATTQPFHAASEAAADTLNKSQYIVCKARLTFIVESFILIVK
ncbi:hypothetical protein M3180_15295 [Paenibacillus camelliae]|nr:hypothetical protein [Paenibacillus camelliae]